MQRNKKIGVFDSGYGGLTVLAEFQNFMPEYEYIYLGDNARAPYGDKSFEVVYQHTLQAVKKLFSMNCDLVILACNTASAKALRTIQQQDLNPKEKKRVLGVIRPSVENVGKLSINNHIGILGTVGTVKSDSYRIELQKYAPQLSVQQEACPLWVPMIESGEYKTVLGEKIVHQNVMAIFEKDPKIDVLILACTHYPLIENLILKCLPKNVKLLSQGKIVAQSLKNYLNRHDELKHELSLNGESHYYTSEDHRNFEENASLFLGKKIKALHLSIEGDY
jgi:glutamate racemase